MSDDHKQDEAEPTPASTGSAGKWHPEWVSVEARLPPVGDEIYAIRAWPLDERRFDIVELYVDDAGVWRENGGASNDPQEFTHWMPARRK